MQNSFDRATAVSLRSPDPGADEGCAVHDVVVDPGWTIGDKPNGGYLLATMARAALAAVAAIEGPAHPHVVAASATYLASPTVWSSTVCCSSIVCSIVVTASPPSGS